MHLANYARDHKVNSGNSLDKKIYVPRKYEEIDCDTRQLALSMPFPYKLWIIVKMDMYDFVGWDDAGSTVFFTFPGVQNYLHSDSNIFGIKSFDVFTKILEDYEFQRLPYFINVGRSVYAFQHDLFQRGMPQFLSNIKSKSTCVGERKWGDLSDEEKKSYLLNERFNGDKCFLRIGNMSTVEIARLELRLACELKRAQFIVDEHNQTQLQNYNGRRRGNIYEKCNIDVRCDRIPEDMFENPYESSLPVEEIASGSQVAGYYGTATGEQIYNFYRNLTPRYFLDPKNGLMVKKIGNQKPESEASLDVEMNPDSPISVQSADINHTNPQMCDINSAQQLDAESPISEYIEKPKVEERIRYMNMPGGRDNNVQPKRYNPKPNTYTVSSRKAKEMVIPELSISQPPASRELYKIIDLQMADGGNMSDSSDSDFDASMRAISRAPSSDEMFRFSESSDDEKPVDIKPPLPTSEIKIPVVKKKSVANRKTRKTKHSEENKENIEPKPVKERRKYVRKPKDPNAIPKPKPTKTGKKRGPYKKRVKVNNIESAPTFAPSNNCEASTSRVVTENMDIDFDNIEF